MASQSASSGRKAAVVGLGQMGSGIARNLDKAGLLGGAWDISPARVAETQLSEKVEIGSPAALAKYDAVLFVVPSTKEIEALLNGSDGLLTVPHPGQLLIDLTTSLPSESKRLAAHASAHGRDYLDCAMSGGAAGAAAGTVTLMIGAEADALARARPFLDCIAGRMFHLGAVGAGHTMKLLHNMICHTIFFATAEGCLAAERAGLDLKGVVDVLNASNARSYISEVGFPSTSCPARSTAARAYSTSRRISRWRSISRPRWTSRPSSAR